MINNATGTIHELIKELKEKLGKEVSIHHHINYNKYGKDGISNFFFIFVNNELVFHCEEWKGVSDYLKKLLGK